ncbi:hypothetical protein [Aurantiacibacter marinus]|uniref:Uncharacterized protein n=1 Tax=Aurantiacibacter marinus TaxID=874156 RepID=A0A0H0XLV4_9SPHN|nr:hypothetical protein [Aurantiacibacter marinus]KLI63583.1 hypothetical protein AAV99_07430 [Aurantiacibacter marinus]
MAAKPPSSPPHATLENLSEAKVSPPKPDRKAHNEAAHFAHEENMHKSKLGWVGAVWGSKSEKPGNIAAIVAIVLLGFVGVLIFRYSEWELFSETLTAMMSTISLILGYLFGSSSRD